MWIAAAAGVVLAASSLVDAAAVRVARAATSQENCAGVSFDQGGNWFCRAVGQVTYSNYGQPAGQYDQVVGMDQTSGQCQFGEKTYSGPLAPFDEPVRIASSKATCLGADRGRTPAVPPLPRADIPKAAGRIHAEDGRGQEERGGEAYSRAAGEDKT